MSESKHIQTEVAREQYEEFRALARERDLTIGSAVAEAVSDWIDEQRRVDPADPAFDLLDESVNDQEHGTVTDARTEGDIVDEWSGDNVEFELADLSDTA